MSVQRPRPTDRGVLSRVSAYDLFLLVVPLPVVVGFVVGGPVGEYGGALASLATVCYALFGAPPTERSE